VTGPAAAPVEAQGADPPLARPVRRDHHRGVPRAWKGVIAVLAVLAVLTTAVAALAWYAAVRLTDLTHVTDAHPLRVLAVGGGTVTVTRGPDATEPGTFRLAWAGGQATAGPVTAASGGSVTRTVGDVRGAPLRPGLAVGIEADAYTGDPRTALGLAYQDVTVDGPVGALPAWYVPAPGPTWAILVHGLGGSRADTLPVMPTLHALGVPVLAVTYRGDVGAAAPPDHLDHLGEDEWRDVAAAVSYAESHGARGVVLYGWSMGGALALVTAHRAPAGVRALVLDSPVLDWRRTLAFQAARRHLPAAFTDLVETFVGWRVGMNYGQFSLGRVSAQLAVPTLVYQGSADTLVPPRVAASFAAAHPDLVTLVTVPGADHVSSIDTDPVGYERALATFVALHAGEGQIRP
jgi:pimeloyl-ACP methyl ester carboxylesterase